LKGTISVTRCRETANLPATGNGDKAEQNAPKTNCDKGYIQLKELTRKAGRCLFWRNADRL
jgi:hypothetical protein